jgi:presequence protease
MPKPLNAKQNFRLLKSFFNTDYQSDFYLWEHIKTGAKLLLIENEDENKVFNITFRTPVSDSTGVPHILEHSVLNGSKKYPLKEPFISLIKSSLKTFLNAMTYPDRTTYPVASTNTQDLYNLANVYLDATLNPLLDKTTFLQEGWHYTWDKDKLGIQGVVYNEMQGVFSDPDSCFSYDSFRYLHPDNCYNFESGGLPNQIPTLSYEQFLAYHKQFYHPSGALIFFYGNDKSDHRFELVDSYLSKFSKKQSSTKSSIIQPQKLLNSLPDKKTTFPVNSLKSAKSQAAWNWLLPQKYSKLELVILEELLLGSPTSPLYKALVTSEFGDTLSAGSGMELDLIQPIFSIGLKGVKTDLTNQLRDYILETLQTLAKTTFPRNSIIAAINSTKFALLEYDTGSYPKGLSIILGIVSDWIYDYNWEGGLCISQQIADLENKIAGDKNYFSRMIQELFLDNLHRYYLVASPVLKKEEGKIELAKPGKKEISQIEKEKEELKNRQEKQDHPEILAKLPRLRLSDLDRKIKTIPQEIHKINSTTVIHCPIKTSEIVYLNLAFDLVNVSKSFYLYLPLLTSSFKRLDTKNYTAEELNLALDIHTGNFTCDTLIEENINGQLVSYFVIKGKTRIENFPKLLDLLMEIIQNQILDNQAIIKEILMESRQNYQSGLVSSGYQFALSLLAGNQSKSGLYQDLISGVGQYEFISSLTSDFEKNYPQILKSLSSLKNQIFNQKGLTIQITNKYLPNESYLKNFVAALPKLSSEGSNSEEVIPTIIKDKNLLIQPIGVNYVCKSMNIFSQGFKYSPLMILLMTELNLSYLHEEVRVKKGAYGCGIGIDKYSGILSIYSYRDPESLTTLETYKNITNYLENLTLSDDSILELIINSVGKIDSYKTPKGQGYSCLVRYLMKVTDTQRQKEKDEIFKLKANSLQEFKNLFEVFNDKGQEILVGGKELKNKFPKYNLLFLK